MHICRCPPSAHLPLSSLCSPALPPPAQAFLKGQDEELAYHAIQVGVRVEAMGGGGMPGPASRTWGCFGVQ